MLIRATSGKEYNYPFHRWKKSETERLSNLVKAIQLKRCRGLFPTKDRLILLHKLLSGTVSPIEKNFKNTREFRKKAFQAMEYSTRGPCRVSMDHKGFMDKLKFLKRWHQYIKWKEISVYSDWTALRFSAGEEGGDRGWDFGLGSFSRTIHLNGSNLS